VICPACGYENFAPNATNCDLCHAELGGAPAKPAAASEPAAGGDALAADFADAAKEADASQADRAARRSDRTGAPRVTGSASAASATAGGGAGRAVAILVLLGLLAAGLAYLAIVGIGISQRLTEHQGIVHSVEVGPDGRRALTASEDRTVVVWDVAGGGVETVLRGRFEGGVTYAGFLPGGRAVTTSRDGAIRLFDLAGGAVAGEVAGPPDGIAVADAGPGGERIIAVADLDGAAAVYDLSDGSSSAIPAAGRVYAVAFSPVGDAVATGDSEGVAGVWTPAGSAIVSAVADGAVRAVAFSDDGAWVAAASSDQRVLVFNASSGDEVSTTAASAVVTSLAFRPGTRQLVGAGSNEVLTVWDAATGRVVAERKLSPRTGHPARALVVTPDGARAFVAVGEEVRVVDLAALLP